MKRRVLLIVNPISGRSRARRALPRFTRELSAAGLAVERHDTRAAGDGAAAARRAAAEGFAAVVAVGGDGTVGEVIDGQRGADLAVGILPTGTANLLARDLGVPFDPIAAARVVAAGTPRTIDAALARGAHGRQRSFHAVAGVGFDAAIVHAVAASRRGSLGYRGYLGPLLRAVRDYDFPPLDVRCDGGPPERAAIAVVCNTRSYAGLLTLVPGARVDDGLLDVCLVDARRRPSFLRYLWAAWRGTLHRQRDVRTRRASRVRIDCVQAVPAQLDGDPFGSAPLEIEVAPATARVLAPDAS